MGLLGFQTRVRNGGKGHENHFRLRTFFASDDEEFDLAPRAKLGVGVCPGRVFNSDNRFGGESVTGHSINISTVGQHRTCVKKACSGILALQRNDSSHECKVYHVNRF